MKPTLFLLSSFAFLISSASIPSSQTIDTTPSSLSPTPTHASASMTGTPATQPSFAPEKEKDMRSAIIETVLVIVFGLVAGLSLLFASAWILWKVSGRIKQREAEKEREAEREREGKFGDETDGESVLTKCEKEKDVESRVDQESGLEDWCEKEVAVEVEGRR